LLKILAAGETSHEEESMDRLINPGELIFNELQHLQGIYLMKCGR